MESKIERAAREFREATDRAVESRREYEAAVSRAEQAEADVKAARVRLNDAVGVASEKSEALREMAAPGVDWRKLRGW